MSRSCERNTEWTPLIKHAASESFNESTLECYKRDMNTVSACGSYPIHFATLGGNSKTIQYLLDHGSNINSRNHYLETPLHWAIKVGRLSVIKLLIHEGADITAKDSEGNTPLHWAAEYSPEAVALLVKYGASRTTLNDNKETPLAIALLSECERNVALLSSPERAQLCSIM